MKTLSARVFALLIALSAPALVSAQTVHVLDGPSVAGFGSVSSAVEVARIELTGPSSFTAQITDTASSTKVFEVSNDGTTWQAVTMTPPNSTTGVTTTTGTGHWSGGGSYRYFRVRVSSWSTGTVTATLRGGIGGGGGGGGGAAGSVTVTGPVDGSGYVQVNCTVGCSGSKTDDDDASIAIGQTGVPLSLGLTMAYDGTVWRRLTFGTAGTASAQVLTVQGISSMTPLQVQSNSANLATVAKQPALGTAGTASSDVITVQGIASMTKLLVTPDLPSGASTAAKQPALGTAGSASADVITVQGIASMTALKVDGSAVTQPISGSISCSNCSGSGVSVNEDVASANGDPGTPAYTVRSDTLSTTTSANGDYQPLKSTADGRLWADVDINGVTLSSGRVPVLADINNGSTTDTDDRDIATGQSSVALTAGIVYAYDGTSNKAVRSKTSTPGSSESGLVVRPLAYTDGTNTAPTMDAAARAGFQKITDGTNTVVVDPCKGNTKSYGVIDIATSTATELIAGTSAKKTYICSIQLISATAQNVGIWSGTTSSTACDTGKGKMFGGSTAATGWNFAANGGISIGNGDSAIAVTGANADKVCITSSSTGQISGNYTYVVQ